MTLWMSFVERSKRRMRLWMLRKRHRSLKTSEESFPRLRLSGADGAICNVGIRQGTKSARGVEVDATLIEYLYGRFLAGLQPWEGEKIACIHAVLLVGVRASAVETNSQACRCVQGWCHVVLGRSPTTQSIDGVAGHGRRLRCSLCSEVSRYLRPLSRFHIQRKVSCDRRVAPATIQSCCTIPVWSTGLALGARQRSRRGPLRPQTRGAPDTAHDQQAPRRPGRHGPAPDSILGHACGLPTTTHPRRGMEKARWSEHQSMTRYEKHATSGRYPIIARRKIIRASRSCRGRNVSSTQTRSCPSLHMIRRAGIDLFSDSCGVGKTSRFLAQLVAGKEMFLCSSASDSHL